MSEQTQPRVPEDKSFYSIFTGFILLILGIYALVQWSSGPYFTSGQIFSAGILALIFVLGSYQIEVSEVAYVTFLGRALFNLPAGSGYILIIPLFFKLRKFPNGIIDDQYPAKPELIFKNDDKFALPEGMVRPVRIPTASAATAIYTNDAEREKLSKDPLNENRLIVEPSWNIYYQVENPILLARNIGSLEKAKDYMRDTSEGALYSIFGVKTAAQLIHLVDNMENALLEVLRDLVSDWGIKITKFKLRPLDLSHKLSEAIRDTVKADYEMKIGITKAEEIKRSKILVAEGEKAKLILEGEGMASQLNSLIGVAKKRRVDPVLIVKAQTIQKMFQDAKGAYVTSGGLGEFAGVISMLTDAIKQKGGSHE